MKNYWLFLGGCGAGIALLILAWTLTPPLRKNVPPSSAGQAPAAHFSPFRNTQPGVEYCGATVCVTCHADAHSSYNATAHSRALTEVDLSLEPPAGEFTDEKSLKSYRISHRDGQMYHQESIRTASGELLELAEFPMVYTIGSGRFSRSYLLEMDGFLYESPATWYTARQAWEMSPGYEHYNSGFQRPVELRCLLCHAGRLEPVNNSPQKVDLQVLVIDCERCHGPGALHVSKWEGQPAASQRDQQSAVDDTIVNPAHLDRLLAEDICAQCHLHSAATVEMPERRFQDFRPGLRLAEFAIHFGKQTPDEEMHVVGHTEQMRLSRCYQDSQALTCTTCHHPHAKSAERESLDNYRAVCLSCHTTDACRSPMLARQANGLADNCLHCHMPRGDTEIPHFAFTHHRIGIHQDKASATETEASELVPLTDVSDQPPAVQTRNLGLAYLQYSDAPGQGPFAEQHRERALGLLQRAARDLTDDADIMAGLARLHWNRNPRLTLQFAERTMKQPSRSPEAEATATFTLGSTLYLQQRPSEAIEWLERTVRLRPTADVWYQLSDCYARSEKSEAALTAASRAVRMAPDRPRYVEHLSQLLRRSGDDAAAESLEQRLEPLRRYRRQADRQAQ